MTTPYSDLFRSAYCFDTGSEGHTQDKKRAAELYLRAIEKEGHVWAMYNLGLILASGTDGVTKDTQRAAALFTRAVQEGSHVLAMYSLGLLLEQGAEGVRKDVTTAAMLYKRAAEEGNVVMAMNNLANLVENGAEGVEQDAKLAVRLYERAIKESGNRMVMYNLANLLVEGREGVERDATRAKMLYEAAIEEPGFANALNNYGNLLLKGAEGVKKDAKRAAELYERAVREAGDVSAMFNLGRLFHYGNEGVAKDESKALQLYSRAVQHGGQVDAMYELGRLLQTGAPKVVKIEKRAAQMYERAIKEGQHTGSHRNLAKMLWTGVYQVPQDRTRAISLLQVAVDAESKVTDMILLGKWLLDDRDKLEENAERTRKLLKDALKRCTDSNEKRDVKVLLQKSYAKYDIFISHAGTEKESVAEPLREMLKEWGVKCFLDEQELHGSTYTSSQQLMYAIRASRSVVFILSLDFASRKWPMLELMQFFTLLDEAKKKDRNRPLLIPLFYKLTVEQCKDDQLPFQDDNLVVFRKNGFFDYDRQRACTMPDATDALKRLTSFVGIRNDKHLESAEYARYAAPRVLDFLRAEFGRCGDFLEKG